MNRRGFLRRAAVAALPIASICRDYAGTASADSSAQADLLAAAAAKIEKYRKADATVMVLDAAGKPVPSARVATLQTRHAFLFGCNIFMWGRAGKPADEAAYRQQFHALFNFATLPFYWLSYEPSRGRTDHARIEQMARWCRDNGIVCKGHPLAWNHTDPRWLPNSVDEVRSLQMARIDDCVKRFQGLIDIWDVVNEATHFEREECRRRAPKLTAMWEKIGRVEFVRECLQHARAANPRATLLINDYRTDPAYAALLGRLEEDRRPFDVIGIQSHMHRGAWSNAQVEEVCGRFARFGVPLHFTEATILSGAAGWERAKDREPWPSTPDGEKRQAKQVEEFYTMLFSHPAVAGITWWDFSDRGAWQSAPAGLVRADMSPKPAYDVLRNLVRQRWWTRTTAQTGPDGASRLRAFLGEHQVIVTTAAGKKVEAALTLQTRDPARLTVRIP